MAELTYDLNTGAKMPALGLGTWQSPPGKVKAAVSFALRNGYRLIDCAYCYANEDEVGEGLKEAFSAGIKREDVFLVSKLWTTYSSSDERVRLGLEKSLKALGVDYLDLFLVHWPVAMNPDGKSGNDDRFPKLPDGSRDILRGVSHIETWKSMEKLLDTGKVKAIGVCNYSTRFLEELLPIAKIVPAVCQIENHPNLPQDDVVALCKSAGIHVEAYSPFGSQGGPVMHAEPVVRIAEKHNVPTSVVLLSYHLARGSSVLAKSTHPDRIKANLTTINLDSDDMKCLEDYSADLHARGRLTRYVYPAFGVDFGFPDVA